MTRIVSVFARSALALVTATVLIATPAAAEDDFEEFPEKFDEFGPGPGFEVIDPTTFPYPEEWDPNGVDNEVTWDGFVLHRPSNLMFDPYWGEEIDLISGDAWAFPSGDPVPGPDPFSLDMFRQMFNVDMAGPVDPAGAPIAVPGTNTDLPTGEGLPQENPESYHPILPHYRLGTDMADLGEYALDPDDYPDGAIEEAFQFIAYEIALLNEIGVFNNTTPWKPAFDDLSDKFGLQGADRTDMIRTFQAVDAHMSDRSQLYGRVMTNDQADIQWVLNGLSEDFMGQIVRGGGFGALLGREHAVALMQLLATGAQLDVNAAGTTNAEIEVALAEAIDRLELQEDLIELLQLEAEELRNAVAGLSNPALDRFSDTPSGADESGGSQGVFVDFAIPIAIGVAVLLAALIIFGVRRQGAKRRGPDTIMYDSDETVATTQLLAGAKDEAAVLAVLDRAARRQFGTPLTLFHATPDGLLAAGEKLVVMGSDLRRVIDSGQHVSTVLTNDPALGAGEHAVVALPVIHGGKVRAILVAHREGDDQFTDEDKRKLDAIAPALGGAMERAHELGTMSKLAMIDGLTSLGNRRRLDGDLETTLADAVAGDMLLGFAMVDVDNFKTYNDTHGHTAGDEVLRRVAETIAEHVRDSDVVYRYGGEEFSMLLPGASPEEAAIVAERVRAAVEETGFPGEELQPGGKLTVSVGVATLETGSAHDLKERADAALYEAKEGGRNRVVLA